MFGITGCQSQCTVVHVYIDIISIAFCTVYHMFQCTKIIKLKYISF